MQERIIPLRSEEVKTQIMKYIMNLPADNSLEIVVRDKEDEVRQQNQNALLWAALMADVTKYAFVAGKQFSNDTWHEYFKRKFLPEGNELDYDKRVTRRYKKWKELPDGERILTGSTTQLTKYGFSLYYAECEAYAAVELGIQREFA